MHYIVNQICEIITERQPALEDETIVLVNGFEHLKYYAEIASKLQKRYSGGEYSINIKLAKRKWDSFLADGSDTHYIQMMKQNGWVAEKESVTFYRNQHNVNILVLMGTEDEEDTGGLANCFTISPKSLTNALGEKYHKIFRSCFENELSATDKDCVDGAYKGLFEFVPADICKLSDMADNWFKSFETINDFCEEYGKNLIQWGLPNRIEKPIKPASFCSKTNFLRDERDFISGKLFQRLSQKKYIGLEKKLSLYAQEGKYSEDSIWRTFGFDGYSDFAKILLEFIRGENVQDNRHRLLKVDYSVIDDILRVKLKDPVVVKVSETSISGEPIIVVLNTALNALKIASKNNCDDLAEIHFTFSSASIVTGYTDVDDEEKEQLLTETWRNICIHVNGVFDFINRNEWKLFERPIKITYDSVDFFDPLKVKSQVNSTVTVATGTNTLNKINFSVELHNDSGEIIHDVKDKEQVFFYSWKFGNEVAWLYDFKDIAAEESLLIPGTSIVPIGSMKRIKNTMVIKSEEEFFDIYDEDSIDFSFDLHAYVSEKTSKSTEYEIKEIRLLFGDLGTQFCHFVQKLSSEGFYKCLCGDNVLSELNKFYMQIADKLLQYKFPENLQWIKDAYLQAFVIEGKTTYLSDDSEPECVIVPPWHPVALQKIIAQKSFLIDGLCQRIAETNANMDVNGLIERFVRMTEIQSSIDVFPADGNDYMGVLGTYGNFCVYGNEKNVSAIRTRVKDILRKEAIYDEEFKASELIKMNDDAKMIYDVLTDYNKAMPSVKCSLSVVFINPPDLQPIISAISKYTKEIHRNNEEAIINIKLSILVRPENKGGKNYLTYWMDDYFSEEKNTSVRIYLNEWTKKNELDKLLSDNNDIVFNMDFLHAETFRFIPSPGTHGGKVTDCRFPIVYKPSPLSQTSTKRKIELTQTQFSAEYKYTQVVRYKKNPEVLPVENYLAVRESGVEPETKSIIDMLHKKAYWVVCIDKVMDGALLRGTGEGVYSIIGFSTGKGMYGQYNLTITARNSILETIENKLKDRLYRLFKWQPDVLNASVKKIMEEARGLDGISMLSAINQKGTNINEFMAYVMTSLRERVIATPSSLKVIIHLDSYKHWFDNSDNEDTSMRPDFLMLSVIAAESGLKLKAEILECKTALYKNYDQHVTKASKQVKHGLEQLQKHFDPCSNSIERRYWFAQLYRALVFAQVTFSDSSDEFLDLSAKLRAILDGEFEIDWSGKVLGYWVDKAGEDETISIVDGVEIYNIPQQRIQNILRNSSDAEFVAISGDIIETVDDEVEESIDREADTILEKEREEMLQRKKSDGSTSVANDNSRFVNESEDDGEISATDIPDNKQKDEELAKQDETPEIKENEEDKPKEVTPVDKVSPIEEVAILDDARILIGKDRVGNDVFWEFGHKDLSNRHLLITGTSGQGKTYCIQTMLYELSKSKISTVVFDYTEGFRKDQLENRFVDMMGNRINEQIVYFTGVPINPFKRYEIELSGMKAPEKVSDVAQRIASTLTHVYRFGEQQFAAIYSACRSGLEKHGDKMNMELFLEELSESDNKSAGTVKNKLEPFVHSVEFSNQMCDWADILYNPEGKLTIFQLTSFVREIQVAITEFMLWDMWHYTKKNGNKNKPFAVVLDEAQNLSHSDSSPSGLILTEGRKFGWSAWYATQSLKILNDDEITRLMQAAFKLYFKPTDSEIAPMAKQLNPLDANEWKTPLTGLKKGECIVVGSRIQKDGTFKNGKPTTTKVTSFDERK